MYRERERIIIVAGEHRGRKGSVALTHVSPHTIIVKMLGLTSGRVRVVLDHTSSEGTWSGVVKVEELRHTRPESDEEFYQRIVAAYKALGDFIGKAGECKRESLDLCARALNLARDEVARDD